MSPGYSVVQPVTVAILQSRKGYSRQCDWILQEATGVYAPAAPGIDAPPASGDACCSAYLLAITAAANEQLEER